MAVLRKYLAVFLFLLPFNLVKAQCTATINSYPYQESFETGTANWVTGGINNDWAWGSPTKPTINAAGAGSKCWITGGLSASFYSYGERSWIESPCFDFTTLNRPYVSFLIFWETERNYDGGNFQYSTDLGITWKNAGSSNDPNDCNTNNWFNNSSIVNLNGLVTNRGGWSGTIQSTSGSCNGGSGSGNWKQATHCLKVLANEPQVKFRFTFGSGTTCNDFDGIAFDDFYIGPAPSFPDSIVSTCVGNNKLTFNDANPDCHNQWDWNFGDASSSSNTFSGNNATHEFTTGGIFTVTLNTSGECAIDTQLIKQVKILSAEILSTPVSCVGDRDGTAQVVVSNASTGISYAWSHDPILNTSTAIGLSVNDYYVTVTEPGACSFTTSISIVNGPDAYPSVSLGHDTVICPGSEIVLLPGSFITYRWQDNSTDSFFVVKSMGFYFVNIANSAGCTAADTIIIKEDCIHDIIIPNAFTPNGDARNELFIVSGSETSEFTIFIFNRWGEMIFTSNDRNQGWDGSVNGNPVQEGFYNYLVNYSVNGSERIRKGSIYLLR